MVKKTKNYRWIITLVLLIVIIGIVLWVFHVVREGNNFSACLKNVAIINCELKGMEYFTHENAVNVESSLLNTYECKEIGIDKVFPENYHEFEFQKSEVEKC